MKNETTHGMEQEVMERLEAAAATLEAALNRIEARQKSLTGELERISATVETQGEETLAERLEAAEREIERLREAVERVGRVEAAQQDGRRYPQALQALRRTLPVSAGPGSATEMLAKHGEGGMEMAKLDAALQGLSLEQRIAVKSQLRRAGSL